MNVEAGSGQQSIVGGASALTWHKFARADLFDKISQRAIFHLAPAVATCDETRAMVAHDEPVKSWGDKPCRGVIPLTTTCVSAGGGAAPRPPGTGRGNPEVQTFRNIALKLAYGHRHFSADVADRRATNGQISSHAAASAARSIAMAPSNEGSDCDRATGGIRETFPSRVNDDLGTAAK